MLKNGADDGDASPVKSRTQQVSNIPSEPMDPNNVLSAPSSTSDQTARPKTVRKKRKALDKSQPERPEKVAKQSYTVVTKSTIFPTTMAVL
jgi:hypothetical protein